MWKPVRLQGVGAASASINADAHPAGKLDDVAPAGELPVRPDARRRRRYQRQSVDPTGTCFATPAAARTDTWRFFNPFDGINPQIDRMPLEATSAGTPTCNGNLAELLQEPTLMGAYEGAGITVLSKGVDFRHRNPFEPGGRWPAFPDGHARCSLRQRGLPARTRRGPRIRSPATSSATRRASTA